MPQCIVASLGDCPFLNRNGSRLDVGAGGRRESLGGKLRCQKLQWDIKKHKMKILKWCFVSRSYVLENK